MLSLASRPSMPTGVMIARSALSGETYVFAPCADAEADAGAKSMRRGRKPRTTLNAHTSHSRARPALQKFTVPGVALELAALADAVERDAVLDDAAVVDERHAVLDSGRAVRNLREVVAAQLLLLLHAERAVVCRDDLQVIRLQALPKLRLVRLLAERRRHHVLRAVEAFAVIVNREEEVLRARLRESRQTAVARLAHLIQSVGATEVDDIDGRLGHLRNRDGAVDALGLGDCGPRQRVILRRGAALRERALDGLVDDDAVLGVHADEAAALARPRHRAEDGRVVNEEDAGVGHEHLEARHALVHDRVQFFDAIVFKLGRDEVEAVVNRALPLGLRVPVVQALDERLPLVLHSEVNDGRRPAVRRRNRARAEVVGRFSPAERQLHVRVRVYAAGADEPSGGVNHAVGLNVEPRADGRDGLAVNQYVGPVVVNRRNDAAISDKSLHGVISCLSPVRMAMARGRRCRRARLPNFFLDLPGSTWVNSNGGRRAGPFLRSLT